MWKWHSEMIQEAWDDMVRSMEYPCRCGETRFEPGFEPEAENIVNSASRARKLLDELKNPRLRIVMDLTNNLVSLRCNQKEVLDESFALIGDAIGIAHAKDRDKEFQACAPGKGILDFEYYLRSLKQSGFAGPLIMHGFEEEDVAFARDFLHRA
jgi:sugar phosphate isomerase/epimerase